ncbi:MAG TPA: ABC transporter permease [Gemmatimonadaceae bacterium]|nr:ABC transporter permease [Gemmatimonadaceae bacterium]
MSSEIRPGIRRLLRLVTRRTMQQDADEEIRIHLELRTKQLIGEGMSPSAARAEAERRFGEVDDERRRSRASAARQERRLRWRDSFGVLRGDVRYAFRTLRRDAGFTVFALAIMALGIGASATVFSLINGVLLRPMPFRDPSRLVWIGSVGDNGVDEWRVQVAHFVDLGARSRSLSELAGYYAYYSIGDAVLRTRGGDAQRLTRVPVTCNFFPFLGVTPRLGRSFSADECLDNSAATTMLTEKTWREQFAADPSIVGRVVTINDQPVQVIGVLPASFDFASVFAPGTGVDLFTPYALSERNNRNGNTLGVIGRVKPGVSIDQARTELGAIGKQLMDEFPRRNSMRPHVRSLDEHVNGRLRPALIVLAFAVAAVMLIVALNLASLQFARMTSRSRELAVRLALGASRGRLIRQTLTESLVLAAGGATLGVAIALLATRYVSHLRTFDIPLLARVTIDPIALGAATIIAVVTGVIVGVSPAMQAPSDPNDALKEGTRGSTRGGRHARVRSALVVTEIAAALVLLVASSLLLRSFVRVLDTSLGFAPEHLARLRVDPPAQFPDLATASAYYDEVVRRVRAIPGVTHASLNDMLPFAGDRSWAVPAEGRVYKRGQYPEGFIRVIGDDYFRTMSIPIRAGRAFANADTPDAPPVVIINESMARTLWPDRSALGQRIVQGKTLYTVVGIVGDTRHTALESAFTGEAYFSLHQSFTGRVDLVVRTSLPLSQVAASARAALDPVAPVAAKGQWRPMQELIDQIASPRRFVVVLLAGFAAFALVLAALGIYALISYGVTQRRQEIGIRIALGASSRDVRGSIMRNTLRLAVMGMALGVAGAMVVVPTMSGLLFGVAWSDPVSFVGAVAILLVVAATAGLLPAHRASRVDPSVVLRDG